MQFSAALTSLPDLGEICVVRFSGAKFGDEWKLAQSKMLSFAAWIGRPCVVAQEDDTGDWELRGWESHQNLQPVKQVLPALNWYQMTLSSGGISTDFPQTFVSTNSREPF
jgi:hypothetical protein